jgi:hypothetical protein
MTEPRTHLLPTDIDAHNNVLIWDHGPPTTDPDYADWCAQNADSDLPKSVLMDASTARHAISVAGGRYKLEPTGHGIEAEVDSETKNIQAARVEAAKRAAATAAAAQLARDYAVAAVTVAAAVEAAKPKVAPVAPAAPPPPPVSA